MEEEQLYEEMSSTELKLACKVRNLSTKGSKRQLIEYLGYYEKELERAKKINENLKKISLKENVASPSNCPNSPKPIV